MKGRRKMIGRRAANHLQNILYIYLNLGVIFMCIQNQFHLQNNIFYSQQLDSVIQLFVNVLIFQIPVR